MDEELPELLRLAFLDFTFWRKAHRIPCSQRKFKPSSVDRFAHGAYLASKAYNARVLLEWLNDSIIRATTENFEDSRILGRWLRDEVDAGRRAWPTPDTHPFLFLEPVASHLGESLRGPRSKVYGHVCVCVPICPRHALCTWYGLCERSGRFLSHEEAQAIHDAGMKFCNAHLELTRLAIRQG